MFEEVKDEKNHKSWRMYLYWKHFLVSFYFISFFSWKSNFSSQEYFLSFFIKNGSIDGKKSLLHFSFFPFHVWNLIWTFIIKEHKSSCIWALSKIDFTSVMYTHVCLCWHFDGLLWETLTDDSLRWKFYRFPMVFWSMFFAMAKSVNFNKKNWKKNSEKIAMIFSFKSQRVPIPWLWMGYVQLKTKKTSILSNGAYLFSWYKLSLEWADFSYRHSTHSLLWIIF